MCVPLEDLRGQEDEDTLYSWVSVEQFVFIHWVLQIHEDHSCKHFVHFITRLKMLTEEAANSFVSVHSLLYSTVDSTLIQTSLNQRVGHFLCRWFWWLSPITNLGLVWWTVVLEIQWGKWGDSFECKTRNWGGWGYAMAARLPSLYATYNPKVCSWTMWPHRYSLSVDENWMKVWQIFPKERHLRTLTTIAHIEVVKLHNGCKYGVLPQEPFKELL